jgi:hypothetical protein
MTEELLPRGALAEVFVFSRQAFYQTANPEGEVLRGEAKDVPDLPRRKSR